MVKFLLWLLLLVVCWPLALLALVLWPVVWLLSLPFRLVGILVEGVFIFVGYRSNTEYIPGEILNDYGEVMVDMRMRTSVPGLFAAGDLRSDSIRQIVAAASDGATAALAAYDYLEGLARS